MVGRICNNHGEGYCFQKGEEKGRFEFGGSTVILLLDKNQRDKIDPVFFENTAKGLETRVRLGEELAPAGR